MTGHSLRVVFFGTPQFAVPTLDALLASRHTVVGVVTQPDRPSGRGQKTHDAPVKARALAAGLPVQQPTTLRAEESVAALRALNADIGVVAAYGKILTEAILAVPPMGMINVHASLLPRWRGAAPVHRAVIAGDRETGVTIMRVVKALDAGAMLATVRVPIDDEITSDALERTLAVKGATLLAATLDRLADGPIDEVPQDEELVTYAHRLTKDDGIVDWSRSAIEIHNQIRGLHPWPHAFSFLDGKRFILRRSSHSDDTSTQTAGTIVTAHGDDFTVATGAGLLRLLEIQAEGKRPMTPREFLAGARVHAGQTFTAAP